MSLGREELYLYVQCMWSSSLAGGIPVACQTVPNVMGASALQIDTRDTPSNQNDDYCYIAGYFKDSSTRVQLLNYEDPSGGIHSNSIFWFGDTVKRIINSVNLQ